ncbi:MAG: hypothetical protein CL570_02960 [Alphaproteobacteria bacterium]|nr:hypothetical protein [Alphaproteobacteria bacterium]
MIIFFRLVRLFKLLCYFSQNGFWYLYGLENIPDLLHHNFFVRPDFLFRIGRITAYQIDVLALLNVARHHSARYRTFEKPAKDERVLCFIYSLCASSACSNGLTGIKQLFAYQGFVFVRVQLIFNAHHAVIKWILDKVMQALIAYRIVLARTKPPFLGFAPQFSQ